MITHLSLNSSKTASIQYQLQNNFQPLNQDIPQKSDASFFEAATQSKIISRKYQQTSKINDKKIGNQPTFDVITRNCYISPDKNKILFKGCSPDILSTMNSMKDSVNRQKTEQSVKTQAYSTAQEQRSIKYIRKNSEISETRKSKQLNRASHKSPRLITRCRPLSNPSADHEQEFIALRKLCEQLQIENSSLKNQLLYKSIALNSEQIEQLREQNTKLTAQLEKVSKHESMLEHLVCKLRYQLQEENEIREKVMVENEKLRNNLKRLRNYCLQKENEGQRIRLSFPSKLNFKDMNNYYHNKKQQSSKKQMTKGSTQKKQNLKGVLNIEKYPQGFKLISPHSKRILCDSGSAASLFELSPD